jgi:hypothetical protein
VDTNLRHLAREVGDSVRRCSSPTAFSYIFMTSLAESAALADRHREPVVETTLRLTQELLRLRPEGMSSDRWLGSIFGLARAVAKVATVAGGSAGATTKGTRLPGSPSCPSPEGESR